MSPFGTNLPISYVRFDVCFARLIGPSPRMRLKAEFDPQRISAAEFVVMQNAVFQ